VDLIDNYVIDLHVYLDSQGQASGIIYYDDGHTVDYFTEVMFPKLTFTIEKVYIDQAKRD
jgi:hypothetical protein